MTQNEETLLELLAPEKLLPAVPALALTLGVFGVWLFARYRNQHGKVRYGESLFRYQMATIGLFFLAILILILFLPMDAARRGQLLSFLGVVLSAMLALSSTSILGNALAGLMLRAQHSFRPGDFLRVDKHFGRVTERGLFHTEIQNEDRELTSLPNLFLAQHPHTVLRASGTLVSATVSLGYDVPRKKVEQALLEGATDADLEEPFVRILELGDFSIVYRVSGLLEEVKRIVSTRARLHARVLSALHRAGIEIVSPNFMNQRVLSSERIFVPTVADEPDTSQRETPEALMFDKAELAGSIEQLRDLLAQTSAEIEQLQSAVEEASSAEAESLSGRLRLQEARAAWLSDAIEQRAAEHDD